jgi:predicted transporter
MDTTTLLIIVLLVLVLFGVGWYGRRRWRGRRR